MSAPRLVVCGLEPGPAVALGRRRAARRLRRRARRPPRPPRRRPSPVAAALRRLGAGAARPRPAARRRRRGRRAATTPGPTDADLTVVVAVEPALDRWEGVKGSRAGGRRRGARRPARPRRRRPRAGRHRRRGRLRRARAGRRRRVRRRHRRRRRRPGRRRRDLRRILEETAKLPVLGWLPPQLSEQFARQYGGGQSWPAPDRSAAGQGRRGGALPRGRRVTWTARGWRRRPRGAASCRRGRAGCSRRSRPPPGLTLAVAWGPPLEPFALEAVDLFKAMGLTLEPLHVGRDEALPGGRRRPVPRRPARRGAAAGVRRQRRAQGRARGRPSPAACRRWRWAAAPCSCSAASPTAAAAPTSWPASCRPRPSSSSGTSVPGTCAPRRPARTRTPRATRPCTSCSTSSS